MTYAAPAAALVALGWLVFTCAVLLVAVRRIRNLDFGVERRDGIRFAMNLPAQMDTVPAQLTDASLGGAQLVGIGAGPGVGEKITLTVSIPQQAKPLVLDAVVRSRRGGAHRVQFLPGQWHSLAYFASAAFGPSRSALSATAPGGPRWSSTGSRQPTPTSLPTHAR